MKASIFDLDGTVIDSSHRQLAKPDGSLDLDKWIENSTFEKVMQDKVLPLAKLWGEALSAGHIVAICTARVLATADHIFLSKHGLFAHRIFSRPLGDTRRDHVIKVQQLSAFLVEDDVTDAVMYDDNADVRDAVSQLGVAVVDPIHYNQLSI